MRHADSTQLQSEYRRYLIRELSEPVTQNEIDAEAKSVANERADLLARRAQAIRAEQHSIDDALAAGATFVLNRKSDGSRSLVHTTTCGAIRHKLDRQAEWDALGEFGDPDYWPSLSISVLTREEVEAKGRYRRCRTCSPEVAEWTRPSPQDSMLVQSLTDRHLGSRLFTLDGTDLGQLEDEVEFVAVLRTSTGTHRLSSRDRVRVQRPAT
ncbi:hypothetical protein [Oerskovia enterophila]|uniref:hypothetical protein n=1 Tax=Oerskovia enterophila TaxID=43678 RepID=UPI00111201C4|nr:hypothetical protein [Oerskovia enterophila]